MGVYIPHLNLTLREGDSFSAQNGSPEDDEDRLSTETMNNISFTECSNIYDYLICKECTTKMGIVGDNTSSTRGLCASINLRSVFNIKRVINKITEV